MHQLNTDCAGGVTPDHKAGLCQQILFHSLALTFCTFSVIAAFAEPVECRGCLQESLAGWRVALLLCVPRGPSSCGTCQQKSRVQHRLCRLDGLQRTFLVTCTPHRVPGLFSAQRSASRPGPLSVPVHQKRSCLCTDLGHPKPHTCRDTALQQGFPGSHGAAAWPPAPF